MINSIIYRVFGPMGFKEARLQIDPSGYFYTKEGKYLEKIGDNDNVYITDESSFLEKKK